MTRRPLHPGAAGPTSLRKAPVKALSKVRLGIASLLVLLTAGCIADDGRQVLVVYSPHGSELLRDFESRFEAERPDVDVQWLDMGSQEVLDRIRSERANPQADVWYGGPSQLFAAAAEDGLLEPHTPEWMSAVAGDSDDQGRYLAIYYTPLVIAYNSEVVSDAEAPSDWLEVGFGAWKDRTDIGDAVEWQRRERASWTRPWDSDYEEVRAEFPDLFDEQDDREHEIHKAWATEHGVELGEAYPDLAAARATSGKASAQPKKKKAGK